MCIANKITIWKTELRIFREKTWNLEIDTFFGLVTGSETVWSLASKALDEISSDNFLLYVLVINFQNNFQEFFFIILQKIIKMN